MAVTLNLKDIQSGFLSASAFNANNTLIEEALAKTINRTSNADDNAMEVDLDLGLRNINNLATAFLSHQAVNLAQAKNILAANSDKVTSTSDIEVFTATEGQTVFTFSLIEYIQDVNALLVFINGVYQLADIDYTEASTTSIEFNTGLSEGDTVVVLGARFNADVFYTETQQNADEAADSASEAEHWASEAEDSATAAAYAAGYKLGINTQSGTTYNLVASDEGDLVRMTNSGDNTVVVPTNSSVPFEIGTIVNVRQSGLGTTTISPASGVVINAPLDEYTTDGEEFGLALVKVDTDEWDLVKSYAGARASDFEAEITASSGAEGYQKLSTGLIFQWGSATIDPLGYVDVVFPIAFPTAAINISLGTSTTAAYVVNKRQQTVGVWENLTNTSVRIRNLRAGDDTSGTPGLVTVHWFAIGV